MNVIASILQLDRRAVKALRITDAYSLHRVVYSLYPDVRDTEQKTASTPSGILYADRGGDHRGRQILMLADRMPAEAVERDYGRVKSKEVPPEFLQHAKYRFKVIVNPTRRDSASRKLVPMRGREAVADWFAQKSIGSWGFSVSKDHLQVDRIEVQQFKDKHRRQVTVAQAHVQGLLTVVDAAAFRSSFTKGVGRARAYGCGLLQIVPVIGNSDEQGHSR